MNDLRERFVSPPEGSHTPAGCPDAQTLWDAVSSQLPPREFERVVLHVGTCAACTVAFRLARQHHLDTAPVQPHVHPASAGTRWSRWTGIAAAAVLLVLAGVLATGRFSSNRSPVVLRASETSRIVSLLPDGVRLPRDAFVLRWSAGPAGSHYTIRVTDDSLTSIVETRSLEATEYQVDPALLERLPGGSRVLWQVEATGPGGYRIVSPTFTALVE